MAKKRDRTDLREVRYKPEDSRELRSSLKVAFLTSLRDTCNVYEACRTAKVTRSVAYEWREKDETFAKLWDEAVEEATDALEKEARRRAIDGWDEPVFTRDGMHCGNIRRYSDKMLELLLRAHRPGKFRERVQVEHEIGENLAKRLENARRRGAVIDVTPVLPEPE